MRETEEELKSEIKIKEKELNKGLEKLEQVRHQSVVILARLEELKESDKKLRIKEAKKELELQGYREENEGEIQRMQ